MIIRPGPKFVQDIFEVEFLMHRRGRTAPPAVTLSAWQVAAQPLPFIDILLVHPVTVTVEDYLLRIPSPEALMVHKLIVAQRCTGKSSDEKREKDLQQCSALAEIVRGEEVHWILTEKRMSKAVQRDITNSCREADLDMESLGLHWR